MVTGAMNGTVCSSSERNMRNVINMMDWDIKSKGNKPRFIDNVAEVLRDHKDVKIEDDCIAFCIKNWKEDNKDKDPMENLDKIGPIVLCKGIAGADMVEFNNKLNELIDYDDNIMFKFEQRLITTAFSKIVERLGDKTHKEIDITTHDIEDILRPLLQNLHDELFKNLHENDKRTDLLCRFRVKTNLNWEELCNFILKTYNGVDYTNFKRIVNNELILKIPRVSKKCAIKANLKTHVCANCDAKCNFENLCSGCGCSNYCSKSCFVAHWKTHKPVCLSVQAHNCEESTCECGNDYHDAETQLRIDEIQSRIYTSILQQNLAFLLHLFGGGGELYEVFGTEKYSSDEDFILIERNIEAISKYGISGAIKKWWAESDEDDEIRENFMYFRLRDGGNYVIVELETVRKMVKEKIAELTPLSTKQSRSMTKYAIDYKSGVWKGLKSEEKYFVAEKFKSSGDVEFTKSQLSDQTQDFQDTMNVIKEVRALQNNDDNHMDKMILTLMKLTRLKPPGKFKWDSNTKVGREIAKTQVLYSKTKDDDMCVVAGKKKKKQGQNDKCNCGSGKKFKKCCGKN